MSESVQAIFARRSRPSKSHRTLRIAASAAFSLVVLTVPAFAEPVSASAWSHTKSAEEGLLAEPEKNGTRVAARDGEESPAETIHDVVPTVTTAIGEEIVEDVASDEYRVAQDDDVIIEQPEDRRAVERDWLDQKIDLNAADLNMLYEIVEKMPERGETPMSLSQALLQALDTNEDIKVVGYEPLKADGDIRSAWGEFDPIFSAEFTESHSEQSTSSQDSLFSGGLTSIESFNSMASTSISGLLPYAGTQYSLTFNTRRDESTYNFFTEEWSGGGTINVTQPLLRGFGKKATMARIRVAKNSRRAAVSQVRSQLLRSMLEVINAYWDLVGATENVRVQQESLINAERLLEVNQENLRLGKISKLEVLRAQAGVTQRQSDLVRAAKGVRDADNRLKLVLGIHDADTRYPDQIVPVDTPAVDQVVLDPQESIQKALDNRPEIENELISIDSSDIEKKRAANDMLPELNARVSYFSGGRDDELRDIVSGIDDGDDSTSSWGAEFRLPIGNRASRGSYQRAQAENAQALQRLQQTQKTIIDEVRRAVTAIEESRIQVESTAQSVKLQQFNVVGEEKKLELGSTTSFEVLRTLEDLTAAQVNEIQAQIAHEKAIAQLRFSEGTLLDVSGVEFEEPEPGTTVGVLSSYNPFRKED
jgi:outer membrane protein TolC